MNMRRSKALQLKPQPVDSIENLRSRVDRLFKRSVRPLRSHNQLALEFSDGVLEREEIDHPSKDVAAFLDFLSGALPDGDAFLFGGVLRDMALLGRRGFNSDIDVVIEGDWSACARYIESLNARKNKFGGYRLEVAGWPIDIWNARETWAIRQGLVPYKSIASLTKTTVLNWDAILMNWRTRAFICGENYLNAIKLRVLDVVLEENPNPIGMAVRVFRHLCAKDARKITTSAAKYLANCAKSYTFSDLHREEIRSYGNTLIEPPVFKFFEHLTAHEDLDIHRRFSIASEILKRELGLSH